MLVSSTDGVGTKALVAQAAGRFDTIGIDLVAMCVDDIVCQGAEPLFFLDYIAVGTLDPDHIEPLVEGVAEGCRQAGCALIGGEMAEHPAHGPGEFDLVGFAVGVVERDRLITGEHVAPGRRADRAAVARPALQRLLAGPPGAARARPAVDSTTRPGPARATRWPTSCSRRRSSTPRRSPRCGERRRARRRPHHRRRACRQPARVLPEGCDAVVERGSWEVPRDLRRDPGAGEVADDEMARVFNLGIGMVVVVPPGGRAGARRCSPRTRRQLRHRHRGGRERTVTLS